MMRGEFVGVGREEDPEAGPKMVNRAAAAKHLRELREHDERVAGLVALCEELLEEIDVAATGGRVDVSAYQERLTKLKGGG